MSRTHLKCATKQKEALTHMLNFHEYSSDAERLKRPTWKVLVYDRFGQDIISPLFSLSELRECGVTLNLPIHSDREGIPETSAIYFIQPSEENLKRICADMKEALYSHFYLSFISSISRDTLERLANMCIDSNCSAYVSKIFDEYLNFISLEDELFVSRSYGSRDISFAKLNSPLSTNEEIQEITGDITDTLFSLISTLNVCPVIKCQKGNASELVGKELEKRIRDSLIESKGLKFGAAPSSGARTPLLFLYDRSNDLCPPLHHAWTYQALIDDIYGITLNRTSKSEGSKADFDFSPHDKFMKEHKFCSFPAVASNIQKEVEAYKVAEASVKNAHRDTDSAELMEDMWISNTSKLSSAVNSLSELIKRKKFLDMHTNIASSIMDAVKQRNFDVLFELEEKILARDITDMKAITNVLNSEHGEAMDKLRLFLICHLCDYVSTKEEVSKLVSSFEAQKLPMASIKFVSHFKDFVNSALPQDTDNSSKPYSYGSVLSRIVAKSPQFVMQGVKSLVMRDKHLPITRLVVSLLEGTVLKEAGDFLTINPRDQYPQSDRSCDRAKQTQFDEIIVFVVGGGCYFEYQNLMVSINKRNMQNKNVIYGCSELMSPVSFLNQLNELGNNTT